MQNFTTHKKATIYCLSRKESFEPVSNDDLLPNLHQTLKTFFNDVTLEKTLSRPTEEGKDFIFIFCEGVTGNVDEGDLKSLVDAIQAHCTEFFDSYSITSDKDSQCTSGNILFVLKMKGADHVEIFSTFPAYHFTLD